MTTAKKSLLLKSLFLTLVTLLAMFFLESIVLVCRYKQKENEKIGDTSDVQPFPFMGEEKEEIGLKKERRLMIKAVGYLIVLATVSVKAANWVEARKKRMYKGVKIEDMDDMTGPRKLKQYVEWDNLRVKVLKKQKELAGLKEKKKNAGKLKKYAEWDNLRGKVLKTDKELKELKELKEQCGKRALTWEVSDVIEMGWNSLVRRRSPFYTGKRPTQRRGSMKIAIFSTMHPKQPRTEHIDEITHNSPAIGKAYKGIQLLALEQR